MSRTLNFAQHILEKGRNLLQQGQTYAASRLLDRLSSHRQLPKTVAEETHFRLAEVHLNNGHLKKARRRLCAALLLNQDNVQYHFLMAKAAWEDENCDPRRALTHYRRCTQLAPRDPAYWCALGLNALDQDEKEEGLKALRQAAQLAPDDYDILSQVAEGLREEGAWEEAKDLLKTAIFRNSGNHRMRELWDHHQFHLLHAEQIKKPAHKKSPRILPFKTSMTKITQGAKRIRRDPPSGIPGPKSPAPRRVSGNHK